MKNRPYSFLLIVLFVLTACLQSIGQQNVIWNKKKATVWFNKKEWLADLPSNPAIRYDAFGRVIEEDTGSQVINKPDYLKLANIKPHASINKVEFAKQYHANAQRWKTAFSFLQATDLAKLSAGRHLIDGDNVYALVTEGPARREDTALWEAHRNYADIQYVIKGEEKINVTTLRQAKVKTPYNSARDISFYTAKGKTYKADPGTFFIFFPEDVHRPNLQLNGEQRVKKIVVKVKLATD